jgi:DNA processing protein
MNGAKESRRGGSSREEMLEEKIVSNAFVPRGAVQGEFDKAPPLSGEALRGWLGLLRLPRSNSVERKQLFETFGAPSTWLNSPTIGALPAALRRLVARVDWDAVDQDLAWLADGPVQLMTWDNPEYPALLREIADPPVAFYYWGELPGTVPSIAIVGSRRASHAGREAAHALARELGHAGVCVISGLALGIDTSAHLGALAAQAPTVAVLGGGLGHLYPRANHALAERIAMGGAVLSEYPPMTAPRPPNFPYRNRIISGLALGVVVVEAAQRSGSLITARLAGEQGRDVYAMPGALRNPLSRGCHQLIRDGAVLVESAEDVLNEMVPGWVTNVGYSRCDLGLESSTEAATQPPGQISDQIPDQSGGQSSGVLSSIDFVATPVDLIIERSGLTAEEVSSILLTLELNGEVHADLGGTYSRATPGGR